MEALNPENCPQLPRVAFLRRSTGRIKRLVQLPDGRYCDSGFPRPMTLLELRWAGWVVKPNLNLADDEF